MDIEIKDILVKLLEGQTRLQTDVNNIKSDINNINSDVNNIKSHVNKNSIKLETIEKKLDIIAEVQTSHKEQNERPFREIDSKI